MTHSATPHGTDGGYVNHGCRCASCREAHRLRVAEVRRIPLSPTDPRHGTPNAYRNRGCRCAPCCAAVSVRARAVAPRPLP